MTFHLKGQNDHYIVLKKFWEAKLLLYHSIVNFSLIKLNFQWKGVIYAFNGYKYVLKSNLGWKNVNHTIYIKKIQD